MCSFKKLLSFYSFLFQLLFCTTNDEVMIAACPPLLLSHLPSRVSPSCICTSTSSLALVSLVTCGILLLVIVSLLCYPVATHMLHGPLEPPAS